MKTFIDRKIEQIANSFGYTTADVMQKNRNRALSTARNYIYYILHFDCGMSTNAIARKFQRDRRNIARHNAATKYRVENFKDCNAVYAQLQNL